MNVPTLSMLRKIAGKITRTDAQREQERLRAREAEIEAAYRQDLDEVRREMTAWDQLMPFIVGASATESEPIDAQPEPRADRDDGAEREALPSLTAVILEIVQETPARDRWRASEFTKIIRERGMLGGRTSSSVNMAARRLVRRGQAEQDADGFYVFPTLSDADRARLASMDAFKAEAASSDQIPVPDPEG